MAGSVNKVILVGNVGKDPVIRRTQDGRPIASFSIATSESWKDKSSGEKREKTEWHNIVIFNENLCRVVEQFVKKGSKLYIEGQLQTRKWEKDGVERYSTEVVLQNFGGTLTLLDSRNSGQGAGAGAGMQESGGGDYDSGPAAGGGYSGGSGGAASGYGGRSGNGAPAAKSGGGAKGGFDKQLDDEIPF